MQNTQPVQMSPAAKKRALGLVFFVMLMDIIGLSILAPVAPFIVERYTNDALTVTLLTGIYAAAQFIAAPAIGNIGDRVGRRPVLIISVLGSAIGYFVFGFGGALWVLFLARLIDGVTAGNLSTASAYIADVSTPEERPKNFAMIGIAFGLGFILGPALSAAASLISVDAPAFVAGGLGLLSVIVMFFALPESLPAERRVHTPLTPSNFNPLVAIGEIARKPGMPLLIVITCVFAFAFNGVNTIFSKYLSDKFLVNATQIAVALVFGGVVLAIVQGLFVERLVKRFGEKTMTVVALLGFGLGFLILYLAPTFWWVYPTALLRNGVGGFFWATTGAMSASKVLPHEQGKLAGVNTALQSLMAVFGPVAAGVAYDAIAPGAPMLLGALLFGLAALITLGIRSTRGARPHSTETVSVGGHA